jgi:uncharacterized protein (DUF4213/DUF364 family)
MPILDEILATITEDEAVSEVRTCVFWTAVVSRGCGLASTGREEGRHAGPVVKEAGALGSRTALELAGLARSDSLREAAIGIAALNSLLEIDRDRCSEVNASRIIAEKGRGKRVVIVGGFPFIPSVREVARELTVLEQMPWPGTLPAGEAANVIPQADVVAITGSSFINHSFEGLLSLCSPKAFVIVLGPSTPVSPVLFDHGVDVLSGTQVVDIPRALRYISQGAIFKQVRGVRLISMSKDRT